MAVVGTATGAGDPPAAVAVAEAAAAVGRMSTRTYPATTGTRRGETTGGDRRGMIGTTGGMTAGIGDGIMTIGRGIAGRGVGAARRFVIGIGIGIGIVTVIGIGSVMCTRGGGSCDGLLGMAVVVGWVIWQSTCLAYPGSLYPGSLCCLRPVMDMRWDGH